MAHLIRLLNMPPNESLTINLIIRYVILKLFRIIAKATLVIFRNCIRHLQPLAL